MVSLPAAYLPHVRSQVVEIALNIIFTIAIYQVLQSKLIVKRIWIEFLMNYLKGLEGTGYLTTLELYS